MNWKILKVISKIEPLKLIGWIESLINPLKYMIQRKKEKKPKDDILILTGEGVRILRDSNLQLIARVEDLEVRIDLLEEVMRRKDKELLKIMEDYK